ncbi:Serine/threonine-protein kinase WAG1 [Sesamum alatum]|uniref:non-specific serine/threonine protein kinase n=1 Tax=Sesamum alatum TaxID=300844 RepID=A0AAE2CI70_9LAMI|nr:Serine/threonine-protein kinase WAG1 [Sesamum alatum]
MSPASATLSIPFPSPTIHVHVHVHHDNITTTLTSIDHALHARHLKLLRSGNLDRVSRCRLRNYEHANFALKVIDRDSLSSKKLSHVQTDSQILSSLDHPFSLRSMPT